jgi:hypothetical protein
MITIVSVGGFAWLLAVAYALFAIVYRVGASASAGRLRVLL